ncbi:hypothetical protein BT96DRAFT_1008996 [Gymnopus androsaceus JB14]|uniref:Uncharacterized protein n=1 Tax=Gymnopus androsaceus JB14 TaxID=1447944 RepID=A0A6A4GDJ9_9AGAR|nr:hypothetical protein BT96DRAFT_1008996 [Gymnopus androsaceus JB14]
MDSEDEGEPEESGDEDNLTPQEQADKEKRLQDKRIMTRNLASFKILCNLIPGFMDRVDTQGLPELMDFCSKASLHSGARAARSDDINNLKEALAHWLNFRPLGQCPNPILKHDDRTGRGFSSDLTGKLLTPIELDWQNPSVRSSIRAKTVVTSNSYFLRAFYSNEDGDPTNVEENFLKSTLLLQTWRQIFMSNGSIDIDGAHNGESDDSTAVGPPATKKARKSTRKTVAQLLDLKEATPRSIAYACVMLRFALSDAKAWNSDRSFNYEGLYLTIIDYLEDVMPGSVEEKQIQELLKWWTKNVFGEEDASKNMQPVFHFKNVVAAQRAAKLAECEAAEADAAAAIVAAPLTPPSTATA